jgi:polyhydroxyalkanoate synthase subunit PhaC
MANERTEKPSSPATANPWLAPFEAGRQWMELASKAQTVLAGQLTRDAGKQPFSPEAATQAFSEFFTKLMTDPMKIAEAQSDLWQRHATLWQSVLSGGFKDGDGKPKDRRFKDEEWDKNIAFNVLKHNYQIGSEWLRNLVSNQTDLSPDARKQVQFFTERFIEAAAPTNFALTNPTVLRKTTETGGANLVQGLSNFLDDLAADAGHVRRAADVFELGVNMANSKGSVILRTDMMELIQYDPTTEKVAQKPLLLVPPWVNKFYLFDLQPKSSFIKWAVDQGFTVFAISWVNPDARHAQKDFENYWLEGPLAALEAIERATGERSVNIISYCLGGTMTIAGLAHLAATGQADRVASATMIATMTDFERFGDFETFVTDDQVATLEAHLNEQGYLTAADMTRLFSLLRANDLIWSSAISSYLLAEDAVASDLVYWFSDGIGMPGKMLTTFIRKIILDNALTKPGHLTIGGVPIDLKAIKTPLCFVSLRDDHVCAWQSTYKGATQFETEKRFVLGGSGHNAGTISHPSAGKHGYWISSEFPADAESWFKTAQRQPGSWWPDWERWLRERSGPLTDARIVGAGALPALEPAPGAYVRVRS